MLREETADRALSASQDTGICGEQIEDVFGVLLLLSFYQTHLSVINSPVGNTVQRSEHILAALSCQGQGLYWGAVGHLLPRAVTLGEQHTLSNLPYGGPPAQEAQLDIAS